MRQPTFFNEGPIRIKRPLEKKKGKTRKPPGDVGRNQPKRYHYKATHFRDPAEAMSKFAKGALRKKTHSKNATK